MINYFLAVFKNNNHKWVGEEWWMDGERGSRYKYISFCCFYPPENMQQQSVPALHADRSHTILACSL